jgi:hypothetical protein
VLFRARSRIGRPTRRMGASIKTQRAGLASVGGRSSNRRSPVIVGSGRRDFVGGEAAEMPHPCAALPRRCVAGDVQQRGVAQRAVGQLHPHRLKHADDDAAARAERTRLALIVPSISPIGRCAHGFVRWERASRAGDPARNSPIALNRTPSTVGRLRARDSRSEHHRHVTGPVRPTTAGRRHPQRVQRDWARSTIHLSTRQVSPTSRAGSARPSAHPSSVRRRRHHPSGGAVAPTRL